MRKNPADRAFARYQAKGEPKALAKVFDLLAPELLLVAAHFAQDEAEAEDLVQTTFLEAIESVGRFDPTRPLRPWLIGILIHRVRRARDKAKRALDPSRLPVPRQVDPVDVMHPVARPPQQCIWFRTVAPVPDDDHLNRCMLAYVSDYNLLPTASLPHGVSFLQGNLQMASLDHGMWFHRAPRIDDWMLYAIDSPSASGARGFARGAIYRRDGTLVASTAQEGVIRLWESSRT